MELKFLWPSDVVAGMTSQHMWGRWCKQTHCPASPESAHTTAHSTQHLTMINDGDSGFRPYAAALAVLLLRDSVLFPL